MALTQILNSKCFGGYQKMFILKSTELLSDTKFAVYLPPIAEKRKVPVLYWLSGLDSNQEKFIQKSGAQRYASEHGICIVCPDVSPRNIDIPEQNTIPHVGDGAGFYVDAVKPPWNKNYRMFSYVNSELIKVVNENFPVIPNKKSIAGHSMGGHGALISALKNPGQYCSISAVAPVANPIKVKLCHNAFNAYLGDRKEAAWHEWDATELVKTYNSVPVELFIDQGTADPGYIDGVLLPENLIEATARNDKVHGILKLRDGYEHSHYFIASVIQEHIKYHSKFLNN